MHKRPTTFEMAGAVVVLLPFAFDLQLCAQGRAASIPHLRKQGTATQLIVDDAPFLILGGTGVTVTFEPIGPGDPIAGILHVQEGSYESGRWRPALHLNGDQTHQGRHVQIGLGEFRLPTA